VIRDRVTFWCSLAALFAGAAGADAAAGEALPPSPREAAGVLQRFVATHCLECHDAATATADLQLDRVAWDDPAVDPLTVAAQGAETWEGVLRRLRTRQMPPPEMPRPAAEAYDEAIAALTWLLDRTAAQNPHPGRTETFRRLTRIEYERAIRDLLALEIDAAAWLPADASSHGFDNVTVGNLSPTLMTRYISAAQKISRLAVGRPRRAPAGDTFRIPADRTQEQHVDGLPLGTRGGTLIPYQFPRDGRYDVRIRLTRDRNEEVEGLHGPHEIDVLLDRRPIERFTVRPPRGKGHQTVDAHLQTRFEVSAGRHHLGVTFPRRSRSLLETKRQPYEAHFNMHRHPRLTPAVF